MPPLPNARVIAELQAFRIALALAGGDLRKVPALMPGAPVKQDREATP